MKRLRSRAPLAVLLALALACNFITSRLRPAPPASAIPVTGTNLTATPAAQPRPAYIPPGCENAAVATIPAATELAVPTPAIQANPPIDPATQLKVFDETARVISDVYVYPDFNGKDWNSI